MPPSLTLSVTSPHSHTCTHVPVLMHTHNIHTHTYTFPRPQASCPPPKGITWGAPRRQGFLGLRAERPRGHGEALQGSPRVWAEPLGGPRSRALAQAPPLQVVQPLPSQPTPPKLRPWDKWQKSGTWAFPGAASSQDHRLALCHGAARRKASSPWHSY